MSRRWLLFGAMCVIWGIPYLLIRVAVKDISPSFLVLSRTALAALVLVPLAAARGELVPLLSRWRPLVLFAAVEIAVPWVLLSTAEQHLSSSFTGLTIAAVPLVGALIARERLGGWSLFGLLLGLAGVAALVGLNLSGTSSAGILEIAGVVVGYAVGPWILANYLRGLPALGVIAASLAITALVYVPIAAFSLPAAMPPAKVVASILTLALVCTALAFVLFFALIEEIGPVRATVITYVNPAVAAVLGVAVLGESFTTGMGVGFALILVGSFLAARMRRVRPQAAVQGLAHSRRCRRLCAEPRRCERAGRHRTMHRLLPRPPFEQRYDEACGEGVAGRSAVDGLDPRRPGARDLAAGLEERGAVGAVRHGDEPAACVHLVLEPVDDQQVRLDVDRSRRRRVQCEELRVTRGREHDRIGHLELAEHGAAGTDRRHLGVRAGNDHDLVLPVIRDEDQCDAGVAGPLDPELDSRLAQPRERLVRVAVLSDCADHRHAGAELRRGDRLVGALAAGEAREAVRRERLPLPRQRLDARDEVEIDRPDDGERNQLDGSGSGPPRVAHQR